MPWLHIGTTVDIGMLSLLAATAVNVAAVLAVDVLVFMVSLVVLK